MSRNSVTVTYDYFVWAEKSHLYLSNNVYHIAIDFTAYCVSINRFLPYIFTNLTLHQTYEN